LTETESTGRPRESKRGGTAIQYISYVVAEETNWDLKKRPRMNKKMNANFSRTTQEKMLVVFVEQQQVIE
jgi:hypothetical protein